MSEIYKKFTPEKFEANYFVDEDQDGIRLDQFVQSHLLSFSRQQVKKKIKDQEVKIIGRPFPHKASTKVYHREQIEMFTLRGTIEDEYWNGKKLDIQLVPEIVFEDDNIVVISKPAYMCAHPTGRHLFNCATVYFENLYGKGVYSIHRLDRETSGIMLIGKTVQAAQQCTILFETDQVKKCYFFMAHKNKNRSSFPFVANERLTNKEDFEPRQYIHCFPEDSQTGKHARTTFKCIHENDDYVIGLAFPQTGRQHQIRTHAAFHGYPLIGDKLYNGDPTLFTRFKGDKSLPEDFEKMQISRHALHAIALKLPYKDKENGNLFRGHVPQEFKDWISQKMPEYNLGNLETNIIPLLEEYFNG
jgi:RluA family pseudouridine synthase